MFYMGLFAHNLKCMLYQVNHLLTITYIHIFFLCFISFSHSMIQEMYNEHISFAEKQKILIYLSFLFGTT